MRECGRFAFAAVLLPQLSSLLWWMHTGSALHQRGWINAEYLCLLAVALLFPCWATCALLTIELSIALVEPIAHLYFYSLADAVSSFGYLLLLSPQRLAGYGLLLGAYTLSSTAVLRIILGNRRQPNGQRMARLALLCALLAAAADVASGRFPSTRPDLSSRDFDLHSRHAFQAPILSLAGALAHGQSRPDIKAMPLPSALSGALSESPPSAQPDIVLVLTESWGLALDLRINLALESPYRNSRIQQAYRVEMGTVPFDGGTTSGETRELCGNSRGYSSQSDAADYFSGCWPSRLAAVGYRTVAVHGFTPTMFNRETWYRRFGFDQSAFLPQLEQAGVALCEGAFLGACDAGVAHWIGGRLTGQRDVRPLFVHWVTLNSHLPIAPVDDGNSTEECAQVGIDRERSLCSWFVHVGRVHASVAELALMANLRPTIFVIVGDHAPPFLRADVRGRFSQDRVPYVVLMPRPVPTGETARARPAPPL